MKPVRTYRAAKERTPGERARAKVLRDKLQKEKPSLAQLVASGEYEPPVVQKELPALLKGKNRQRKK